MVQFRFVVNGDFVEFYDGTQLVTKARNSSQDIDWYYESGPDMWFQINGLKYKALPSQIEIDGVTLSVNTEFDAAIAAIFPNIAAGGEEGGTTLYTGDGSLSGNRVVTLGANSLTFTGTSGSSITSTADTHTFNGNTIQIPQTLIFATGLSASTIKMKSPDNTTWQVSISDAGEFVITED